MNFNDDKVQIVQVDEANFELEVLKSKQPVLVAFYAPWSNPCHILDLVLDEVAAACIGKVKMVKVNADDNPDLSMWYDIQSIPALLFFVNGGLHIKVIGTVSKDAILAKLHPILEGCDSTTQTTNPNQENEQH